jgi:spore coat polysaccharide biosynthesis protein SpsF
VKRKLIAALACRAGGSRLYGKPLQNLEGGRTILGHILECIEEVAEIAEPVLGISEGTENLPFVEIAQAHGVAHIVGDQKDVLWRLIMCAREADATDVFRITTECPFTAWELVEETWNRHAEHGNDITVAEYMPEGVNFEIFTLESLERAHREGRDDERSEFCSAYPRRVPEQFKIEVVQPPPALRRPGLRLTVDYPEDLVLCRRVWEDLRDRGPRIPIGEIIEWLDGHPQVASLVETFVDPTPIWGHVVDAQTASQ